MAIEQDRILIVESDPVISDLIGRQTLKAAGYQVTVVTDANNAILQAVEIVPDVILADLTLPGLSGIDLLVALNSQGISTPVILLAKKGLESEIIQSIRLGAADYLLLPARETEILTVVERILKRGRDSRERERQFEQLRDRNQELQRRIDESDALLDLVKGLAAADAQTLTGKIVDRFCQFFQADAGWLLLKEDTSKAFLLAAQRNLPKSMPVQLNQPWDDGISPLVAASGEPLAAHGEQLKRYKVSALGGSALVLPLKTYGKVDGVLAMIRSQVLPFSESEQYLAFSAADFAAIALANVRSLRSAVDRSRQQEQLTAASLTNERITNELLHKVKKELQGFLETQNTALNNLNENLSRPISQYQREQFDQLQISTESLLLLSEDIQPPKSSRAQRMTRSLNLHEILRKTASRFEPFITAGEISLALDLPEQLVFIQADEEWLSQAMDGLVSNAVKFCSPGGKVILRLEPPADHLTRVVVANSGPAIEPELLGKVFSGAQSETVQAQRPGGLGISMPLIKDIINRMNGKIWVESKPGQGVQFHIVLPAQ